MFDVVIANLPGRNAVAGDLVQAAQWDTNFRAHSQFFASVASHLQAEGRIIMTKANYPELNELLEMTTRLGFVNGVLDTCEPKPDDPRTYYVLEFKRPA